MDPRRCDTIYVGHWIHRSTHEIAGYVSSVVDEGRWDSEREIARRQARAAFALYRVCAAWDSLIADPDRILLETPAVGQGHSSPPAVEESGTSPVLPYGRP